ncbi:uncharacterized protein LOC126376145 [Pectinophora gossypiella]|uniref:uncharacterized protein LOC126376145 n=1 Tax=Pectinophora gossypiella TaxID=13191 RepID=UPI00214EF50A|nr:uncharacterized protein LOC126376145 [Pectinophora gossypiella]
MFFIYTQVLVVAVCVIVAECTLPLMNNMMGAGLHMGGGMMGPGGLGIGIGAGIGPGMMGGMMGGGLMGPGMMGPGMMGPGMMGPGMMGFKDKDKELEKPKDAQPAPKDLAEDLAVAIDKLDNLQKRDDAAY